MKYSITVFPSLFIQSCDSLNSLSSKNSILQVQVYQWGDISRFVILIFFPVVFNFLVCENFTP